jgi:serine/threonine-protein kinase
MSLSPGATIGPYVIDRELGRGGMGVVFLGHDTRLDRKVAIKALPEALATDADRLARFEREAKTLAQLTHANVAGIHGVEVHEDARYLVLEYVEGETLADRLDRGPLPVDEALEIAVQIASGVEAAHDAGVIHRDLKPGNVIVTPDGRAKVLDFGLARSDESHSSTGSVSQAPTLTSPAMHSPTVPGVILGTAAYMSPEQARGRRVDKRTDIWSFGVMLFEMLTGASPFVGETLSDSIGAVLHKDMDLDRLPQATPGNVRRVITRCVQRDRNERYRDIGDARLDLLQKEAAQPAAQVLDHARRSLVPMFLLALTLAIIAGAAAWQLKPADAQRTLHVAIPVNTIPTPDGPGPQTLFDVHPNGTQIAYIGVDPNDTADTPETAIYVRDLDSARPRRLEGTEHAKRLSYSPSGDQIAFSWWNPNASNPEMRRINPNGGPPVTMFVDPPRYRISYPPCWIDDNRLIYIGDDFATLYVGDAAGGLPTPLVDLREKIPEYFFTLDMWSPPSSERLYISGISGLRDSGAYLAIHELDIASLEVREILDNAGVIRLLDNGLATFFRGDTFSAAAWDPVTRTISGEIVPVTAEFAAQQATLEITPSGTLVYSLPPGAASGSRVMSIDRDGRLDPVTEIRRTFAGHIAVSPDGDQLALSIDEDSGPRTYALDIATGYLRAVSPRDAFYGVPAWLPDGRYIYSTFLSPTETRVDVVDLGTSAPQPETLFEKVGWDIYFSTDGALAFMTKAKPGGSDADLFLADMETGEETPLLATPAFESGIVPSPDTRLVAYMTQAGGRGSIVEIRTFDADTRSLGARPIPVSSRDSRGAFWSPDGSELFWIDDEIQALMAVDVRYEPRAEGGPPVLEVSPGRVVFTSEQMPFHTDYPNRAVDISPDGQRFYFIEGRRSAQAPAYLNVVLNWDDEVMGLLSTD